MRRFRIATLLGANSCVDISGRASNNPPMPRPDAVRRIKSYSAADGYVYQYYFFEGNRAERHGRPGGVFTYVVSANRRTAAHVTIFGMQSVSNAWAEHYAPTPTSKEEYTGANVPPLRGLNAAYPVT